MQSEAVAYWFLRLNGFLTTANFILHPDRKGAQRTDADIVGVRFPHRRELTWTDHPLVDHKLFEHSAFIELAIGEVKSAREYCSINGPWTDPKRDNMGYLLRAIGLYEDGLVNSVAAELYARYEYRAEPYRARLFAFGAMRSEDLHPAVVQLTWSGEVLPFIFERFIQNEMQKAQNDQWDEVGRELYDLAVNLRDVDAFSGKVLRQMT